MEKMSSTYTEEKKRMKTRKEENAVQDDEKCRKKNEMTYSVSRLPFRANLSVTVLLDT